VKPLAECGEKTRAENVRIPIYGGGIIALCPFLLHFENAKPPVVSGGPDGTEELRLLAGA
jgi:hypothetical protein